MRRALPWGIATLMLFTIVILVLNLLERDVYEGGSAEPPNAAVSDDDATFRKLVPPAFTHECPTCGRCEHPIETLENRRVLKIVDHDGGYRLLWAADDVYFYDDPIFLAAGFRNKTAAAPEGTWTIRVRAGPGKHEGCSLPGEVALEYRLVTTMDPIEDATEPGPLFPVFRSASWFSCSYDDCPWRPPMLNFGWRLAAKRP